MNDVTLSRKRPSCHGSQQGSVGTTSSHRVSNIGPKPVPSAFQGARSANCSKHPVFMSNQKRALRLPFPISASTPSPTCCRVHCDFLSTPSTTGEVPSASSLSRRSFSFAHAPVARLRFVTSPTAARPSMNILVGLNCEVMPNSDAA